MSLLSELENANFLQYNFILATYSDKIKKEIQNFSDLEKILRLLRPNHVNLAMVDINEKINFYKIADNYKFRVIKTLTQNDTAHFEKLILKDQSGQSPCKKIATIFTEFTQSNIVCDILSNHLSSLFKGNSAVLSDYDAVSTILDSFYIENDDYVDSDLLKLFLNIIDKEKLHTLIDNNIDRFLSILARVEPCAISKIMLQFSDTLLASLMCDFENITKSVTTMFFIEIDGTSKMNPENAGFLCYFLIDLEQRIKGFALGNHFAKAENSHFISSLLRGKESDTPANQVFMEYFHLTNCSSDIDYLDILSNTALQSSSWLNDLIMDDEDADFKKAIEMSLESADTIPDFNNNKRKRSSVDEIAITCRKKQKLDTSAPYHFFQPVSNKRFSNDLLVKDNVINTIEIISSHSILFNFAGLLRELIDVNNQNEIEQQFAPYFVLIDYTLQKLANSSAYPQLGGQIIARHNNAYNAHAISFNQSVNIADFKNYFINLVSLLSEQSNETKQILAQGNQYPCDQKTIEAAKEILALLFNFFPDIHGVAYSNGLSA